MKEKEIFVVFTNLRNILTTDKFNVWGPLEGVGPENRDFLGPEMATSKASAIWAQKFERR